VTTSPHTNCHTYYLGRVHNIQVVHASPRYLPMRGKVRWQRKLKTAAADIQNVGAKSLANALPQQSGVVVLFHNLFKKSTIS